MHLEPTKPKTVGPGVVSLRKGSGSQLLGAGFRVVLIRKGIDAMYKAYKKVDYARPDTDVQMYVLFLCSWLETQSAGGPLRSGFFLAGLSEPI